LTGGKDLPHSLTVTTPPTPFAARIDAMRKRVGAVRELARRVGFPAATVLNWLDGAEPYQTTKHKIAMRTGMSLAWLNGEGQPDDESELAKLDRIKSPAPGVAESHGNDWVEKAVKHIIERGDNADHRSLFDVLDVIQRRIETRERTPRAAAKYAAGSE
jgi:hypothetical protein